MIPITPGRINSNYDLTDNEEEYNSRKKIETKRKLIKGMPAIFPAEKNNSEKILSRAMLSVSHTPNFPSDLDKILRAEESNFSDFPHLKENFEEVSKNNIELVGKNKSTINPNDNYNECIPNSIMFNSFELNSDLKDLESFSLLSFSKKIIFIESSISILKRRADPLEVLSNLEKISSLLKNKDEISELFGSKNIENSIVDFNKEEMDCSLEFIEGYYEASSFSIEIKNKIFYELNEIKELMGELANLVNSFAFPFGILDSVQASSILNQKTFNLKIFNEKKEINTQLNDVDEKREDTLPLTTLRSI